MSLTSVSKAQKLLADHVRSRRLNQGLTQAGLADRSGVSLPTLRKFEQKGIISLESFLKLLFILDAIDNMIKSLAPQSNHFNTIDEVLEVDKRKIRKKGWRK